MIIISDFDGVMVDHVKAACKVWNDIFRPEGGKIIKPEDAYNYGFRTKTGEELCPGIDHKELFRHPHFFEVLEPMEHAVEVYRRLSKKHRIILASSGTFGNIGLKAPWIHDHFDFLDEALFIKTKDKTDKSLLDGSNIFKRAVFIDDTSNCLNSLYAGYKICFGRKTGWNEDWDGLRAYNMTELERMINMLEQVEIGEVIGFSIGSSGKVIGKALSRIKEDLQ